MLLPIYALTPYQVPWFAECQTCRPHSPVPLALDDKKVPGVNCCRELPPLMSDLVKGAEVVYRIDVALTVVKMLKETLKKVKYHCDGLCTTRANTRVSIRVLKSKSGLSIHPRSVYLQHLSHPNQAFKQASWVHPHQYPHRLPTGMSS